MHFKPSLQDSWNVKKTIEAVTCPSSVAAQVEVCRLFCRIIRMRIYIFGVGKQDYGTRDCCSSWRPAQCPLEIQLLVTDIKLTALGRVLQTLRKDFEYFCRFMCLLRVLGHGYYFWVYSLFVKMLFKWILLLSPFLLWLLPMLSSVVLLITVDVSENRTSQKAFWLITHETTEYRCNIGGLRLCHFSSCYLFIHQYS